MIRRIMFPLLMGLAAYYAVFGGEYSILDVRQIHAETERAQVTLEHLNHVTDSLDARVQALEHDPATLETLARENFGMIREGEVLYRFADSDDDLEPAW